METIRKEVGALVREARKRAGFRSVEALAEVLKVHPNTVAGLERGEHWMSPEILPRLAAALKVPPAAFFPGFNSSLAPTPAEALEVLAKLVKADKPNITRLPTKQESIIADLSRRLAGLAPEQRNDVLTQLGKSITAHEAGALRAADKASEDREETE